jgi:pimeloyl-ACP methyl ester carboxylesterase
MIGSLTDRFDRRCSDLSELQINKTILSQLSEIGHRELEEFTIDDTIHVLFDTYPSGIRCISTIKNPDTVIAFFILAPITGKTCRQILEKEIRGAKELSKTAFVKRPGNARGIYIMNIVSTTRHYRGCLMRYLKETLVSLLNENPRIEHIFTRPINEYVAALAKRYGFSPVSDGPSPIYAATRKEIGLNDKLVYPYGRSRKLQMKQTVRATIQEVVLLIHGIRDFAEWEDLVSPILTEGLSNTEIIPLKYGRFDAFRFWFPFWTRAAPVNNLLPKIRDARILNPGAKLSVIAHSFGTYAIGKILKDHPDIRLHRLILCGAILPSDFRWDKIPHSVETKIINDCGRKDIWPVLAQSTTFGYGTSGRFGFGDVRTIIRFHDFGHGGFFDKKFVSAFWLPWFQSGQFVRSEAPQKAGVLWHLLTIIQIKWSMILLGAVVILWFGIRSFVASVAIATSTASTSIPWIDMKPEDCSIEASSHSTDASTMTVIQITNKTHDVLTVYWVNYKGQRQLQGTINPGDAFYSNTYQTHLFVVVHSDGSCIGVYKPGPTRSRAVIQ